MTPPTWGRPIPDMGEVMSEETPEQEQPAAPDTETAPPPADMADEVAKWKALSRKHEQEAKANAAAAKKLSALEEANKTELERAAERAQAAEAKAAALELQVARDQIAREKGVTDFAQFLSGSTVEEIAASADALLAKLPNRAPGRPVEALQSGAVPAASQQPQDVDAWIRGAVAQRSHSR